MDDENDEKDDTKRKSRNLSEKKRRDQFNMLVNELGSMVSTNARKMDKSTVLKSTILFLKNHNETAVRSRAHEIQEDWKPAFLSNEEFTHLTLEALDGFIMVLSTDGRIFYTSESVSSLIGYLPSDLVNSTIYEITYEEDHSELYNILSNPGNKDNESFEKEERVSFICNIKRGGLDFQKDPIFERVEFVGYFRSNSDADIESIVPSKRFGNAPISETKVLFIATGRLQTPQLIQEMSIVDSIQSEFTSRHNLEWKFLFLDQRAPPIIGYLPFEVLGTSGYDYYHVDDLEKVVTCHESLMNKGKGTSCHYRFLTKGQQWIWLQTKYFISYNQWNSKPELIVCTHSVVSYIDVIKQMKKENNSLMTNKENIQCSNKQQQRATPEDSQQQLQQQDVISHCRSPSWSSKSSKISKTATTISNYQSAESETSMSVDSQNSCIPQRSREVAENSGILSFKPETRIESPSRGKTTRSCSNYSDTSEFMMVPMQPNVTTSYLESISPINSSLPAAEMLQQKTILLTPSVQNQYENELQRKHEELQQIINHKQEELRKVSEQLLIAKYSFLPSLLNVNIPCDSSTITVTDSSNRDLNNPNEIVAKSNTTSNSVQAIPAFSVPITLSVPAVTTELSSQYRFPYTIPVNPNSQIGNVAFSQHGNVVQVTNQQFSQQPETASRQQNARDGQNDDDHLIPYQICQQEELIYNNIESPSSSQQRLT